MKHSTSKPTQRSLKHMRDAGYHAEVVERWVPGANVRKDLWGWCDVLCVHPESAELVAVQTTSYPNISARIKKIADSELTPIIRKAGIKILVHGWRKQGHRWAVTERDVS